jgi:hypothetical protein
MRIILLFVVLISWGCGVQCQDTTILTKPYSATSVKDSVGNPTRALKPTKAKHSFWSKEDSLWPRPGRAARLSLVVPGLGQAYNRSWWKMPIVFGALGTTVYFATINNREYQRYQLAFRQKIAGERSAFLDVYTAPALQAIRDDYRRFRDFNIILTALFWALNGTEAYVDAHLKHFTVSDDLSLQITPYFQPVQLGNVPTLGNRNTSYGANNSYTNSVANGFHAQMGATFTFHFR